MALDGLGEKLKSFFKPKEDARFKGQGRKLGSAEAASNGVQAGQRNPASGVVKGTAAPRQPGVGETSASPMCAAPPLQPPPQPLGSGGRPALLVSRSHRTEEVVLDAAVMVSNTPTGREAHLVAASKLRPATPTSPPTSCGDPSPGLPSSPYSQSASPPPAGGRSALAVEVPRYSPGSGGGGAQGGGSAAAAAGQRHSRASRPSRTSPPLLGSSMVSTISTPTAAEKRIGGGFRCTAPPTDGAMADYGVAVASREAYELQRCLAHVLSYVPPKNPQPHRPLTPPDQSQSPARGDAPAPPSAAASSVLASRSSSGEGASGGEAGGGSALLDAGSSSGPGSQQPLEAAGPAPASGLSSGLEGTGTGSLGEGGAPLSPAPPSAVLSAASEGALAAPAAAAVTTPAGPPSASAVSSPAGPRECCDALLRVLRNVLTKPGEPKYRQIRLSNPRAQETIVGVPGAVEFLEAAGFRMEFAPDDGSETANEAYLMLPDSVASNSLAEAFRTLVAAMAAHGFTAGDAALGPAPAPTSAGAGTAAAAGAAAAARPSPSRSPLAGTGAGAGLVPAVDRCTQVLLPAAPDLEVPEWFFERTGGEIRAAWQALVRSRQETEQFMTRTMREVRRQQQQQAAEEDAAAGGVGPRQPADLATVRVRFPEGVCLQGLFGPAEPVSRVFEWVAASLRSPALAFELIQPDRRPLATIATATPTTTAGGGGRGPPQRPPPQPRGPLTVAGADLLPSVLLNLRPTGPEAAALAAANLPLLSDELLRTTRPQ